MIDEAKPTRRCPFCGGDLVQRGGYGHLSRLSCTSCPVVRPVLFSGGTLVIPTPEDDPRSFGS